MKATFYIKYSTVSLLICAGLFSACKKFVEIDIPKSQIRSTAVFDDDITASAAMTGVYYDMISAGNGFASGSTGSISVVTGLSSDELIDYNGNPVSKQFELNDLQADNSVCLDLWTSMYKIVYESNAIIEGLAKSEKVTAATKKQLVAEAKFIRAFTYFYLTNIFGDVPLTLQTDYLSNSTISRSSVSSVYSQIEEDLSSAIVDLSDNYVTIERVRPNKYAAIALLSRVYLYIGEWEKAEIQATLVIDNVSQYSLTSDVNSTFLANSTEAIWQLKPVVPGYNTNEGATFIIQGFISDNILRPGFETIFESGDERSINWLGNYGSPSGVVYFPYKYKIKYGTVVTEYSAVLRLAEIYLIRAEARARQDNISGSQDDINIIRNRAFGAPNPTAANDAEALLIAVEHERQCELFTEWGHRWLDLKRWNKASEILAPIKSSWNPEDVLYPVPQDEINKNPNLKPQNSGY